MVWFFLQLWLPSRTNLAGVCCTGAGAAAGIRRPVRFSERPDRSAGTVITEFTVGRISPVKSLTGLFLGDDALAIAGAARTDLKDKILRTSYLSG